MTPDREINLLTPRDLGPETIAVAIAKRERAPRGFREIAAELSDDNIGQLHEICVEGYGHPMLRKCDVSSSPQGG